MVKKIGILPSIVIAMLVAGMVIAAICLFSYYSNKAVSSKLRFIEIFEGLTFHWMGEGDGSRSPAVRERDSVAGAPEEDDPARGFGGKKKERFLNFLGSRVLTIFRAVL